MFADSIDCLDSDPKFSIKDDHRLLLDSSPRATGPLLLKQLEGCMAIDNGDDKTAGDVCLPARHPNHRENARLDGITPLKVEIWTKNRRRNGWRDCPSHDVRHETICSATTA
jgi:hypothetical protein